MLSQDANGFDAKSSNENSTRPNQTAQKLDPVVAIILKTDYLSSNSSDQHHVEESSTSLRKLPDFIAAVIQQH